MVLEVLENNMTFDEYTKEYLLPLDRNTQGVWADYFYKNDPAVNQFVNTFSELVDFSDENKIKLLLPLFKALAYRDWCRKNGDSNGNS